jgi:hypothetical protein
MAGRHEQHVNCAAERESWLLFLFDRMTDEA